MNKQFAALLVILGVIFISVFLLTQPKVTEPVKNLDTLSEMKQTDSQTKQYAQAPKMIIDPAKNYNATLKTTAGDIVIKLNAKETPITVNNFVFLAKDNFYNGVIFHRVIPGFMIQGGDPIGNGTGGPGYQFADEPFTGDYTRGTVAMANAGPDTNGSQFFIMHADTPLSKDYVIFGSVTEGMEVVDKIATAPVNGETPIKPVTIKKVIVNE